MNCELTDEYALRAGPEAAAARFHAPPALDEQANQRLGRLENALLALKPQIEAMVSLQSKAVSGALSPTAEKVRRKAFLTIWPKAFSSGSGGHGLHVSCVSLYKIACGRAGMRSTFMSQRPF